MHRSTLSYRVRSSVLVGEMNTYLVEEHSDFTHTGRPEEQITFHAAVKANDERHAFRLAHRRCGRKRRWEDGTPCGFYFSATELKEIVKGYLWAASDGSSVAYEVRKAV